MKLRTVKHLAIGGFKNVWVNKLMSLASIGVLIACMSMMGLAIMLSNNIDMMLSNMEKENVIMAYFNDKNSVVFGSAEPLSAQSAVTSTGSSQNASSTSSKAENSVSSNVNSSVIVDPNSVTDDQYLIHNEKEALEVCKDLENIDNVASVLFVSSDDGLEALKKSTTGNNGAWEFPNDTEFGNPLSHGAKITMTDLSLFNATLEKIQNTKGVTSTQSYGDIAEKITSIKNTVFIAGIWIIGILLIISLLIVSNTIRVTMYNRKLEISIMKAVGATDSFIRLPFLVEGIIIGIFSALMTTGLLYFLYQAIIDTIKTTLNISQVVPFQNFVWPMSALFLAIGIFAGLLGSLFIIRKYLKKEGSEFRAL